MSLDLRVMSLWFPLPTCDVFLPGCSVGPVTLGCRGGGIGRVEGLGGSHLWSPFTHFWYPHSLYPMWCPCDVHVMSMWCPFTHLWCTITPMWCLFTPMWCSFTHMWCPFTPMWCLFTHMWCPFTHMWCLFTHMWCPFTHLFAQQLVGCGTNDWNESSLSSDLLSIGWSILGCHL